jgi:hypothetical protein
MKPIKSIKQLGSFLQIVQILLAIIIAGMMFKGIKMLFILAKGG